ncbi:MAG: head GIN domain-containing protein [Bacteroides sp.]|nr:head GIN domain-containing protein [Bacteroides sp.]
MKIIASIITAAFLALNIQSCLSINPSGNKRVVASKNYVTKDIRVDSFKGIKIKGSANVVFTQKSGRPGVEVYTSDNVVDLLDIYVEDGTLYISLKRGYSISNDKTEMRISSADLNNIAVVGSGDILLKNGLTTDNLNISIAGSGDINGDNITCDNFKTSIAGSGNLTMKNVKTTKTEISIAGSGDIYLSGITEEADYSIAGAGDIKASDLQAKRVTASISGAGDIKCYATKYLKTRISGMGNIGYKGDPELDTGKKGLYKL